MITLAVLAALLSFTSETRWLRHARTHLRPWFRYLPQQSGYNKRLRRRAPTLEWLIGVLARDTSLWTDDVWLVDSTPGRVRPLAGDRAPLGPGRLRRVRLLRQPLPLLLGAAPAPERHAARPACRVRPHRRESRRA
jgi:hypothetical protein